jgi:hypothetical protein
MIVDVKKPVHSDYTHTDEPRNAKVDYWISDNSFQHAVTSQDLRFYPYSVTGEKLFHVCFVAVAK